MADILQDIGKIAPTAGGILGGIGGGLLGGAIDVGTLGAAAPLVNPFTLGIAGAGLGTSAGKAVENASQGQSALQGNDITAGLEGAAGQAAGEGAGAVLGKIGSSLLSTPLGNAASSGLARQFGGALDKPTADYLVDNDIFNRDEASAIGKRITGSTKNDLGSAFSKGVQTAANTTSTPVDLTNEFANWKQSLVGHANEATDSTVNNIGSSVIKEFSDSLGNIGAPGETIEASKIPAKNAFKMAQNFRGYADKAKTGSAEADVYNDLAASIEDKIFGNGADVQGVVPFTDADKTNLKSAIADLQTTNPKLHASLSAQIDKANDWSQIRSAQKPFVKISQADNAATAAESAAHGSPRPVSASKRGILNSFARSKTANKAETNILGRLSNVMGSKNATKATALLAGIPGVIAGSAPADMQGGNNMQNTAATLPGANPYATQQMPTTASPLALQGAAGAIGLLDPYTAGSYAPLLQAAQPQLQRAQQAEAALQSLEQAFALAGGGGGRVPGALNILGGQITGGAPMAYQQSQQQLAPILNQLGIQTPLPSLMNTQGAAQTQFQNIQRLLSAIL